MATTEPKKRWTLVKRLLVIPPLLIGIAILAVMVRGKQPPAHTEVREETRRVRFITASETTVVPQVLGYGTVVPGKIWEAVAEVDGKVLYIHPKLKNGALLSADTVLLSIDPTDYRLAVERTRADLRALKAQLREVDAREKNTKASLEIEERALALNKKDLERKQSLARAKAISQAAVDQEERTLLARRQSIQTLQNALDLLPAERDQLQAQMTSSEARLAEAERDLERTVITLPFDARIAEVNVEEAQFAKQGQTLVIADSIDVAEITAQVQIDKMVTLLPPDGRPNRVVLTRSDDINDVLKLTPIVRLKSGSLTAEWHGRVARVSDRIDPATRTVGIIVAVDRPYDATGGNGNVQPPLAKNMYVEVELRGEPRHGQIILPRAALHGSQVYRLNADDRLEIADVTVSYTQEDIVAIKSGVAAGDRIIVSDLIPAIAGMRLSATEDPSVAAQLAAAGGAKP